MTERRIARIVRRLDAPSSDDSAYERRTSARVDFFVERAIGEAQQGIVPDWGPIALEESVILRLQLAASSGPTSARSEPDPSEIDLCAGGWEIPAAWRRRRSRIR